MPTPDNIAALLIGIAIGIAFIGIITAIGR